MKVGLFGGTFNPIHMGHLILAEELRERAGLTSVIFVPCSLPPHKGLRGLASGKERFRMVELAIATNGRFSASDLELKRGGRSYSIETVREIQSGLFPGAEVHFLIGADSLLELDAWKEASRLIRLCEFLVGRRPGFSLDNDSLKGSRIGVEDRKRLLRNVFETPHIGISSTEIRGRISEGRSIRYLVPPEVERYILEKGLYRLDRGLYRREGGS